MTTGITRRILPKTSYDFVNIANSGSVTLLLASKVDVTVFTEAEWIIRVHSGTVPSATALQFITTLDGYEFADPGLLFSADGSTLSAGTTFPFYNTLSAGANFGRLIGLKMKATQSAAGGAFNFTASVDLALKGGDPSDMMLSPNFFRGYRVQ